MNWCPVTMAMMKKRNDDYKILNKYFMKPHRHRDTHTETFNKKYHMHNTQTNTIKHTDTQTHYNTLLLFLDNATTIVITDITKIVN